MSSGYNTLHVGHRLEILWGKSLPVPGEKGGRELITVPGLPEGMHKSLWYERVWLDDSRLMESDIKSHPFEWKPVVTPPSPPPLSLFLYPALPPFDPFNLHGNDQSHLSPLPPPPLLPTSQQKDAPPDNQQVLPRPHRALPFSTTSWRLWLPSSSTSW